MPRIADKNPRYRTKKQMCSDLSFVLNADLMFGTKMSVFNEILWVWTEFDGKFEGCKYWSKKAKKAFKDDKKAKLIHEHLVPRKILREKIFELQNPSPEILYDILNEFCIGVVVTKEEDNTLNGLGLRSKMPSDWDEKNPWARHEKAEISC